MNIFDGATDKLIEGMLTLKTKADFEKFLEDAFTVKEIKEIAQRYEVASMLIDNEKYSDIVKLTGASTATISRVNKCINYGNGGYKMVIDRVRETKK